MESPKPLPHLPGRRPVICDRCKHGMHHDCLGGFTLINCCCPSGDWHPVLSEEERMRLARESRIFEIGVKVADLHGGLLRRLASDTHPDDDAEYYCQETVQYAGEDPQPCGLELICPRHDPRHLVELIDCLGCGYVDPEMILAHFPGCSYSPLRKQGFREIN